MMRVVYGMVGYVCARCKLLKDSSVVAMARVSEDDDDDDV